MLGSVLLDNHCMAALSYLRDDDFYDAGHRAIFRAMECIHDAGLDEPIDPVILGEALRLNGDYEIAGGAVYIAELESAVLSTSNVSKHVDIILDKAQKRAIIQASDTISRSAFDEEGSAEELLANAAEELYSINRSKRQKHQSDLITLTQQRLEYIDNRRENPEGLEYLPSPWTQVNELIKGFGRGHLSIVAGRTSMGKSAMGLQVAADLSLRQGLRVLYVTLEMSRNELWARLAAMCSGVNVSDILDPLRLSDDDLEKVTETSRRVFGTSNLVIDNTPGLTLRGLVDVVRAQPNMPDAVVVDYVQRLGVGDKDRRRRHEQLESITGRLKTLASEENLAAIVLSQVSRRTEDREGRIRAPVLSDLSQGGSLENDADLVMMIHRPDYYTRSNLPISESEVHVRKNRNGPNGCVDLFYEKCLTRFYEPTTIDLQAHHLRKQEEGDR